MVATPAFLYGHYACPHTYIAQGRLDLLASEAPVSVSWRPLAPARSAGGGDAEEGAAAWASITPAGVPLDETVQSLRRDAAALGLTLSLPAAPPDPRPAMEAAEFARDCGASEFARLHRQFFRAVFVDGSDVGRRDVVLELAERAGVDPQGLEGALDDGRYGAALREVEEEAERYGIEATPTILIGRFKLVGAAPIDVLGRTLERARGAE